MIKSLHCFEIVNFSFVPGLTVEEQDAHMQTIGRWGAEQPGFVSRSSYFDPKQGRWTDVVEWLDEHSALAAMAKSQAEHRLANVMAAIDPTGMSMGHFTRRI
jgi:hypothetical protein